MSDWGFLETDDAEARSHSHRKARAVLCGLAVIGLFWYGLACWTRLQPYLIVTRPQEPPLTPLKSVIQEFVRRTRGCTLTYRQRGDAPPEVWMVTSRLSPLLRAVDLRNDNVAYALIGRKKSLSIVELSGNADVEEISTIERSGRLVFSRSFSQPVSPTFEGGHHYPIQPENFTFDFGPGRYLGLTVASKGPTERIMLQSQDFVELRGKAPPDVKFTAYHEHQSLTEVPFSFFKHSNTVPVTVHWELPGLAPLQQSESVSLQDYRKGVDFEPNPQAARAIANAQLSSGLKRGLAFLCEAMLACPYMPKSSEPSHPEKLQ